MTGAPAGRAVAQRVGYHQGEPNLLEPLSVLHYESAVSITTEDIARVCEALPPDKQIEVSDFARFLLARQADEAWEQRLAYPQTRPRLDVFLRDSAAEGDEPLDPNRL